MRWTTSTTKSKSSMGKQFKNRLKVYGAFIVAFSVSLFVFKTFDILPAFLIIR